MERREGGGRREEGGGRREEGGGRREEGGGRREEGGRERREGGREREREREGGSIYNVIDYVKDQFRRQTDRQTVLDVHRPVMVL